jgi:hypothetical protein
MKIQYRRVTESVQLSSWKPFLSLSLSVSPFLELMWGPSLPENIRNLRRASHKRPHTSNNLVHLTVNILDFNIELSALRFSHSLYTKIISDLTTKVKLSHLRIAVLVPVYKPPATENCS